MYKPCRLIVLLSFAAVLCLTLDLNLKAQTRPADAQGSAQLYEDAKKSLKKGNYEQALKAAEALSLLEPDYGSAYMFKGQALLGIFADVYAKNYYDHGRSEGINETFIPIKQAVESFEHYLKLTPQALDADYWRQRIEFFRPYAELTQKSDPQRTVFLGDEIPATKARILQNSHPKYTERARQAKVSGAVLLLAIFSADGTVKNIYVLKKLSDDLTENCIEEARKIKFTPATKDGRPVSQAVAIEYAFAIY